jgi:hypothetical protein
VLWGTPESNRFLGELMKRGTLMKKGQALQNNAPRAEMLLADGKSKLLAFGLPVEWSSSRLVVGQAEQLVEANPATEVLSLVYPNPLNPDRYLVVNSGPTFRTDHDRTNSLQNPHLPDWFVTSLIEPRSGSAPGKIRAAGFFDDGWQVESELTWEAK